MLIFFVVAFLAAQSDELTAYKNISTITDQHQRIEALQAFVAHYPSGTMLARAYSDLFRLNTDAGNEEGALKYGKLYIETYPEQSRMNVYNSVAYTLAEKKLGLKTAAVYAQKAVDLARNASPRSLKMILDTQAFVLYNLGDADSALVLERQAYEGNEDDPNYPYFLSMYEEATGHRMDALKHAASAVLYGDAGNALIKFNEWLPKEAPAPADQKALKTKIVNEIVDTFLKNEPDEPAIQSDAAAFMAKMDVDLPKAETMASGALIAAKDGTPVNQMMKLKTNLAMIEMALGESDKALNVLQTMKELASPYDGDYWYTLGKVYEHMHQTDNALNSYVQGLVAYEFPNVMSAANNLLTKESMDQSVLTDRITRAKDALMNFEPGKNSEKNVTGRTVLTELFTGAECNPCIAADRAFDDLAEYYTRKDLIILEYHLHIPGPDPMTNPDTYARYVYYGGNFGTPTVFFNGGDKLVGGGSVYVVPNRFMVYKHIITKHEQQAPAVAITGTAGLNGNNVISVVLDLKPVTPKTSKNLSLHVALAEKTIAYTGANGINPHRFVVRHLVNGAEGAAIQLDKKDIPYSATIDLTEVQKGIKEYLDDPTKDKSWRAGSFGGWKARPDTIDPGNLAVVAWVQDNATKEILQSYYIDVAKDMSAQ